MKRLILCASVVGVMACGGGSSGGNSTPPNPTTPTTPTPPPANRAPVISTMAMTPAFGVANLTTFSFSVSASDPDGDSITTLWDIAGNPFTGTSGQVLFTTGGNGTARVTVNDGKGGTATDSRTFIVGTMTGTWDGFNSSLLRLPRPYLDGTLTQRSRIRVPVH